MDELLSTVDGYRDEMIKQMTAMLRIPAMGPENGGQGEVERSLFVQDLLRRIPALPRAEAFDEAARMSASFFTSDEAREGMTAFLEKRRPSWSPSS